MNIRLTTFVLFIAAFPVVSACAALAQHPQSRVVSVDNLTWGHLNPLRGNDSPAAADLWGDRTKNTATGMLVKFEKGFSSPPHSHNITYRGIVIHGLLHNDDPDASPMWLPSTSFWTQPAGAEHITAANSQSNMIYLEIDRGPYLVKPSSEVSESGESALNLHASNLVWLNSDQLAHIQVPGVSVAYLWQQSADSPQQGYLVKLPADVRVNANVPRNTFRAVVISGTLSYSSAETKQPVTLSPGSYVDSSGTFSHTLTTSQQTILYVRSESPTRYVTGD